MSLRDCLCFQVGLPNHSNKSYCNTTKFPEHKVGTVLFRTPYNATFLS